MSDHSKIEWTDATWNPVTGCSVLSPGCTNCYAMTLAGTRLRNHPSRKGLTKDSKAGPVWTGEVRFNEQWLTQPLSWKKPRMVFVCAHGDLFHEDVPDAWIDKVFAVMALAPQHTFQVLTKRAKRMRRYLTNADQADAARAGIRSPGFTVVQRVQALVADYVKLGKFQPGGFGPVYKEDWERAKPHLRPLPLSNVWLGVSAERQRQADERIPELLATPAAVRFVSLEPLLGPIDLAGIAFPKTCECEHHSPKLNALEATVLCEGCCEGPERMDLGKLDWAIVGGESGDHARPMSIQWSRELRDQCAAAGVSFFFKQWGEWRPAGTHASGTPGRFAFGDYEHDRSAMIQVDAYPREFTKFGARSVMQRVGKKKAGRLLDGVEHSVMPAVRR